MNFLTIIDGRDHGKSICMDEDKYSIGRDKQNNIMLLDEGVSRVHAMIKFEKDGWYVEDKQSTNGTFLNNGRLTGKHKLKNGDKIAIGNTSLLFHSRPTTEMNAYRKIEKASSPAVILDDTPSSAPQVNIPALASDTGIFLREISGDTEKIEKNFTLLYNFMLSISSMLSTEKIFETVLDMIFEHLPAERGIVLVKTPDGDLLPQSHRVRHKEYEDKAVAISKTVISEVIDTGESILIKDVMSAESLKHTLAFKVFQPASLMCVPLKVQDKILGLIYLDVLATSDARFTKTDLQLLTAMAIQVAVSYENARLYESLLNTTEFNTSILSNVGSGILTINTNKIITKINNTAQALMKVSAADVTNHYLDAIRGFDEIKEILERTLKTGLPEEHHSLYVGIEGKKIPVSINTSIIEDYEGSVAGVIANFRDISKEVRLREQLQKAHRLASLGEMAAGMAHEVRNPLNSIRGFTQLLQEQVSGDGKEYTDIILREVDRMNGIIQDLLEFSQQKEIPLINTDIKRIVLDTVHLLSSEAAEQKVRIVANLPAKPDSISIQGNTDKLKQVFINIIKNAVHACMAKSSDDADDEASEGLVTISCERVSRTGMAFPEIAISVTDNGCGMDEKTMSRIFEPFYTEKDSGTGLGLPICEKIVEAHRGEINVTSMPGQGSMFTIYLPVK